MTVRKSPKLCPCLRKGTLSKIASVPKSLTMSAPIPELTDRMREVFRLVVEAYLERGGPIGSKILSSSISLSSASIRGVMQDLEEIGLLTHPHTSAGRIPDRKSVV